MSDGQPIPGSLYIYAPNKGAPIFFVICFAISASVHYWQCFRHRAFSLVGLHPICATIFTIGYALREYGAFNFIYEPGDVSVLVVFILSQVFIYVCPPLLELANYHVLGRILHYAPSLSPLPPDKVLATFGGLMVVIETVNALGVALSANPSSTQTQQQIGSSLILVALALQLAVILSFAIVAGLFHHRCARSNISSRPVWKSLHTLYGSMALILARSIYRTVEHAGSTTVHLRDYDSLTQLTPLMRHEYYFYIFEATLMLANSVLWNVRNPAGTLRRNVHLAQDGITELDDGIKVDERSRMAKVGNVVTFGMLFRNKSEVQDFHELQSYPRAA
ncbi:putative RTA1 domain protein [Echria macrotheca]|uniref:RTA1 domain protein n=1 Tax=Echria macrotheca TaxID=438768 RepID=A0AAJ0B0L2_9PEZI|nr:putative RTA1 domain protein [Echria macrotheca]